MASPLTRQAAQRIAHVALGLLVLNVLALNVGGLPPLAFRVVALLLVGLWFLVARADLLFGKLLTWRGVALVAGVSVLLTSTTHTGLTVSGALLLGAVGLLLKEGEDLDPIARTLPIAGGLYALLTIFHVACPSVFMALQEASLVWSAFLGRHLLGHSLQLGPTMLGLWIALACVCFLGTRLLVVEWRPWRFLLGLGGLLAAHLFYLFLLDLLPAGVRTHAGMSVAPAGFLVVGVLVVALTTSVAAKRASLPQPAGLSALILGAASAACLAAALLSPFVIPKEKAKIVCYSENEGPILDWRRPEYGVHGPYSQGMFGLLPEYLRADGFEVEVSRQRTLAEKLPGADLLVTINVNTAWTQTDLDAVWSFVHTGGNLLVLGDHTDVQGSMTSQNTLLAPVGIEFQFDGAVPSPLQGWAEDELFLHPIVAGLRGPQSLGIGVGASLALRKAGAEPIFVSRYGLSDLGNAAASDHAFLGDYAYQLGEQMGDLVLVASARYGNGKVLVFGDTSGFQNASACDTYFPFVRNVFAWTSGKTVLDFGRFRHVLIALSALLALRAIWLARAARPFAPLLAAALFGVTVAVEKVHATLLARPPIQMPVAWIDQSHASRIDFRSKAKNSISGLIQCLQRSRLGVRMLDGFDETTLAEGRVFITIAPAEPFTAGEVATLRRFMAAGGLVIAAAGWFHKEPLMPLLRSFDLDIGGAPVGPIPLHRVEGRVKLGVEFIEAWPILVDASKQGEATTLDPAHVRFELGRRPDGVPLLPPLPMPLAAAGAGPRLLAPVLPFDASDFRPRLEPAAMKSTPDELRKTYASFHNIPLAISVRLGKGGLFLVGDSFFFSSRNLEDLEDHSLPNIHLLKQVLEDFHCGEARR